MHRNYPRALAAGPEHGDLGLRSAIAWTASRRRDVGGQVLAFIPPQSSRGGNDVLAASCHQPEVAVRTWGRRSSAARWGGGPVLAAWPDRNSLAEIAEDRQTTALCVVPSAAGETDSWQAATSPELLDQAAALTVDLSVADPVVIQGLGSIFVNQSNMLASSDDRDRAVAVLLTLHRGGHQLVPEQIYTWALANGCGAGGATRLRELAEKISAGRALRTRRPLTAILRADALPRWRDEAQRP